ncbi:MAG: CHAT domain-containing protein [Granulosicoccus sp.]|nr:CHAT domain-containing protein [Granulosicoccus sp.]
MTKLIVPNRADLVTQPSELERRLPDGMVTTRYSVDYQVNRGVADVQSLEVHKDDVIELELDDGQKLWISVEDLKRDFDITVNRSATVGDADGVIVPRELTGGGGSRGLGSWIVKGLKVLGVDIAGSITEFVTDKVEGKQSPGEGLYRCSALSVDALMPVTSIDRNKPILVLIHGTASSTEGSFGGLWQAGKGHIGDLIEFYDDQVLTFQHRSLSLSPIENALELLQALVALPSEAGGNLPLELHLVSHSRGGLIGELLCRGTSERGQSFDADDLQLFTGETYERDRNALGRLGELLDKIDIRIGRFMRVACPARGTTLADNRLDRYLSGLVNILERIPGIATPLFDGISTLLLAVVHKRTQPRELPGLEAMMPTSPTVRMLNRPDITVRADLHVIGGDVMGTGIINRLKVFLTDLYYREDHDLVVNTPSMFGGATRTSLIRYWIDTGGKVNHFRYFGNSSTASRLTAGLLKSDTTVFRTLEVEPHRVTADDYRKRSLEPQPVVFVLPGIMGSHLSIDGDRVWLDYLQIACGGMSRLKISATGAPVQAQSPLDEVYGDLMVYLAATHDVRPFAYDWRVSIERSAELLCEAIEEALDQAIALDQPVRIVAHSMGGLVVRAMLAKPEGQRLWKRMGTVPGSRLIMLGTPNGGSHAIAAMLMGRDALVRKLALLDFRNSYSDLLQTIVGFDGVLQLLPHGGKLDLYEHANWEQLHEHDVPDQRGVFGASVDGAKSAGIGWSLPGTAQLEQAAVVRNLIADSVIEPERMIYVAGVAAQTPCDVTIDQSAPAGRRVLVHATAEGDGRVPWNSGIPQGLPGRNVYYMDTQHGDLAANPDAYPAILQLLQHGVTDQLSNTPILRRGTAGKTFILPPAEPDMVPDRADLVAAAMGGTRRVHRTRIDRVQVRIVHGNLARSRFPVTVGHYKGDTIVSAEAYLDRQLSGRLRERHRLGIYPGDKGTSTILLNWPERHERDRHHLAVHPGAIVIGLGVVGDVTPGALTSSLVAGFMRYALEVRDATLEHHRKLQTEPPQTLFAPLTSLLISSSSDLSISDSLQSILRAVAVVNQRLHPPIADDTMNSQTAQGTFVRINEVDIIEYWEDRAIQAVRALINLSASNELAEHFEFNRQVVEGQDGQRRASFDDHAGWWQRMRISTEEGGALKFETLTERARVESYLQATQRRLVDRFLSRAAASPVNDPEIGKTLFELLMPNHLKEYAPDRRNLILMLNDRSAAYPWELLQDGADKDGRPLAVESGIIRQLISGTFRAQPLMTQDPTALVVGDPVADSATHDSFPPLPGAAAEARQVSAQFNAAAYDSVTLIGTDANPLDVITQLYARPYRIVHIAAHGVFDAAVDEDGKILNGKSVLPGQGEHEARRVTGVVLGDGIYLTPAEFEQMRNVPQLVFINCCHLGRYADDSGPSTVEYHRLAANVATQLIRMGVRAVIAAGWAVDDDAANLFARTFYERMLSGNTFGTAVSEARRASYDFEQRRRGNTWGAYQCYGDPDFSLSAYRSNADASSIVVPVSASEFKQSILSLARNAAYSSADSVQVLKHQLEQLVKVVPSSWYESGSVCSAVAGAYAELGQLKEAASLYMRANASARADASISSLEQLVNIKARWALELAISPEATTESKAMASKELQEAEKIIDSLLDINGSQERYAIKGGVHKRRIMLADKRGQPAHLRKMAEAYGRAHELAMESNSSNAFYPLQNHAAANIALLWCAGGKKEQLRQSVEDDFRQLDQYLEKADLRDADFWTACQEPDRRLLQAMYERNLSHDELQRITNAYRLAGQRGSTGREFSSLLEHLEFFLSVGRKQLRSGSPKDRFIAELEELKKTLQG